MTKDLSARQYFNSTINKLISEGRDFLRKMVKMSKNRLFPGFLDFLENDQKRVPKRTKKSVQNLGIWPWRPFNKYVFPLRDEQPLCQTRTRDAENRHFGGPKKGQKKDVFFVIFSSFFVFFRLFRQFSKSRKPRFF